MAQTVLPLTHAWTGWRAEECLVPRKGTFSSALLLRRTLIQAAAGEAPSGRVARPAV